MSRESVSIPLDTYIEASVTSVDVPRVGYRWRGTVEVKLSNRVTIYLMMSGSIAQWLIPGEKVRLKLLSEPRNVKGDLIALPGEYELYRWWDNEWFPIWPPWRRETRLPRRDPITGRTIYEYTIIAREAVTEQDYMEIVGLEQYHYASKEEIVAVWRCPICGRFIESNIQPSCPEHEVPARLHEIRGSLPSSRFLVLELGDRQPFEPKVVAYVRVDTPIPLMSRKIVEKERVVIERGIREKVFPKDWFHPTFWPLVYSRRMEILRRYRELSKMYRSRKIARTILGEEVSEEAIRNANTAAARIARVVVHPDYRGDGLGVLAVKMALEWIKERRVPEMKRRKHVVETIAQMARYNPFFEKAGFVYMWDTASGRPVLMYPLTDEARNLIKRFLESDPYASKTSGKLYHSRYGRVEPLNGPIVLKNVGKVYTSILDLSKLPHELQEVLRAFGVEKRVVERYVLRNVNLKISPGEVVVVMGASGAGKTTLLRMIIGATLNSVDERYGPSEGEITMPSNVKIECLLPGEHEPSFKDESLLEHVASKTGDPYTAVEILNAVGLSDAVFYRARFVELSTGQKERAKLASMLASKPNLIIVDEFAAHLDPLTAQRVARKLANVCRSAGITLVVATNRPEIIKALTPTKIVFVGYGTTHTIEAEKMEAYIGSP